MPTYLAMAYLSMTHSHWHMPGAPPQPPPQAPHPPPQQTIPCSRLLTLPEDRFKALFAQFASSAGLGLNDRDFVIDGG
jgi:hypothetical protein